MNWEEELRKLREVALCNHGVTLGKACWLCRGLARTEKQKGIDANAQQTLALRTRQRDAAEASARELEGQVLALREALRPFAEFLQHLPPGVHLMMNRALQGTGGTIAYGHDRVGLDRSTFEKAHAALTPREPQPFFDHLETDPMLSPMGTVREPQPPAPQPAARTCACDFTAHEVCVLHMEEGVSCCNDHPNPTFPQPAAEGMIKGPVTVEKVPGLGLQLLDRGLCVNMNSKAALNQIAAALNAQPAAGSSPADVEARLVEAEQWVNAMHYNAPGEIPYFAKLDWISWAVKTLRKQPAAGGGGEWIKRESALQIISEGWMKFIENDWPLGMLRRKIEQGLRMCDRPEEERDGD